MRDVGAGAWGTAVAVGDGSGCDVSLVDDCCGSVVDDEGGALVEEVEDVEDELDGAVELEAGAEVDEDAVALGDDPPSLEWPSNACRHPPIRATTATPTARQPSPFFARDGDDEPSASVGDAGLAPCGEPLGDETHVPGEGVVDGATCAASLDAPDCHDSPCDPPGTIRVSSPEEAQLLVDIACVSSPEEVQPPDVSACVSSPEGAQPPAGMLCVGVPDDWLGYA